MARFFQNWNSSKAIFIKLSNLGTYLDQKLIYRIKLLSLVERQIVSAPLRGSPWSGLYTIQDDIVRWISDGN